jgi:hypothetical protein
LKSFPTPKLIAATKVSPPIINPTASPFNPTAEPVY